ncbi:MAG TPA: metal-sulfur cluster assembly factor [Longimicrobiales bacterium]|nr:metal-sulfur cluster assembly factor [Longimicrobiales bacterium]
MKDSVSDVVQPATSPDHVSSATTHSGKRWMAAVLEASARIEHKLGPIQGERDPRYGSPDPAVDTLWQALHEVADPELPISLVDLGLICDIRRDGDAVDIDVTFTASACPCMEFIIDDVKARLLKEPGVATVAVHDVWEPVWSVERMTPHGKSLLRSFGVAA